MSDPQEIADRLLKDMRGRFEKLEAAVGIKTEDGQHVYRIGSRKHACEATFEPGVSYDRILRNFMGWAEQFARKLGVKKIYENTRDEDDTE